MPRLRKKPRRSPEERNLLIEPLLQPGHDWVQSFVRRKYAKYHADQLDELIQIGYEALIRTGDIWEAREGKFCLYAQNFIRAYIQTYLKNLHSPVRVPQGAWKRDGYVKPVRVSLGALDKNDLYAPTPEDELIDKETLDLLGEELAKLPERERYILEAHFGLSGEARSFRRIAEELDISPRRCDHLSRAEAIDVLNRLEGPLLEIILSGDSGDVAASDVLDQAMISLARDPHLQLIFPTEAEDRAWQGFKLEHGDGPKQIGEFVHGPHENPWS